MLEDWDWILPISRRGDPPPNWKDTVIVLLFGSGFFALYWILLAARYLFECLNRPGVFQ